MPEAIPPNAARSTLAAAVNTSVTTLPVAAGTGARFGSTFPLRLVFSDSDEIALATGRSAESLTVTRGAEGTAATSHASGATVAAVLTHDGLAALLIDHTSYRHDQGVPASVWTIAHNLGFNPSVTVINSAGDVVEGDIDYPDDDTVVLTFSGGGFGGSAYLS